MEELYRIKGDLHTHTVASQHAFSTISELIEQSRILGLEFLAVTDHGPEMTDGANRLHFLGLSRLPDEIDGIRFYKGAEVNIKNFSGKIDLDNSILKKLDFVIASYHMEAIKPGAKEEHTEGWLNVIKNKYVDCLGHMGAPKYDFYHEPVIKALKESGKILEINSNSPIARKGSEENCIDIIRLCKKYDVPVVANSDSHHRWNLGDVSYSMNLLKELEFPPERILNTSKDLIDEYVLRRKEEKL